MTGRIQQLSGNRVRYMTTCLRCGREFSQDPDSRGRPRVCSAECRRLRRNALENERNLKKRNRA